MITNRNQQNLSLFSVVVVFTKRVDAEQLIRTANEIPESRGYFKWIGTDGWTEQLPDHNEDDYLESLNGSDYCFHFHLHTLLNALCGFLHFTSLLGF